MPQTSKGGHGFDGTEALFPPFDVCGIANVADGQGANGPYSIDLEAVSSVELVNVADEGV